MQVAWATDVHLNFISEDAVVTYCEEIRRTGASALLLGGDIAEGHDLEVYLRFLDKHLQMPIYFVLGNHDFYASSVAVVRQQMQALQSDRLHWLPQSGVIALTPTTALVGHGGWGDARHGNFKYSPVVLSDFLLIADLNKSASKDDPLAVLRHREPLRRKLNELGDESAQMLRPFLKQALQEYPRVVVLTHVPPFPEACWHHGHLSDNNWLPFFTCKAMGDLLAEMAISYPSRDIRVLCGHTHGSGEAQILPNLLVETGAAKYGAPAFKLLDFDG